MDSLAVSIRRSVEDNSQEPALLSTGESYSYADLWRAAGNFAGGLRESNVKSGETVGICLSNIPEFVVSMVGTLRNGSIAVPIDPEHDTEHTAALLKDCEASIAVVHTGEVGSLLSKIDSINGVVRVGGDETFGIPFESFVDTSGLSDYWEIITRDGDDTTLLSYAGQRTTSTVGIPLTHDGLRFNATEVGTLAPGGLSASDCQLGILPAYHPFTIGPVILATLLAGGTYWSMDSPTVADVVETLESGEITVFHGVPSILSSMTADGALASKDLSSVRALGCIGGLFPEEAATAFVDAGVGECYQLYGQTEMGPIALVGRETDGGNRLGKPMSEVSVRIVNGTFSPRPAVPAGETPDHDVHSGELVVSSPSLSKEYRNEPEYTEKLFTRDSNTAWFHTGVTAYRDDDGNVYVADVL